MRNRTLLLLGVSIVGTTSCRTRLVGERLPVSAPTPERRELVGVPFQLPRPYFTISRPKKGAPAENQVSQLSVQYIADPRHRYTINVEPALLSKYGMTLNFGDNGNLVSTTTSATSGVAETVTALGTFLSNTVAALAKNGILFDAASLQEAVAERFAKDELDAINEKGHRHARTADERKRGAEVARRIRAFKDGDTFKTLFHLANTTDRALAAGIIAVASDRPKDVKSAVSLLKSWGAGFAAATIEGVALAQLLTDLVKPDLTFEDLKKLKAGEGPTVTVGTVTKDIHTVVDGAVNADGVAGTKVLGAVVGRIEDGFFDLVSTQYENWAGGKIKRAPLDADGESGVTTLGSILKSLHEDDPMDTKGLGEQFKALKVAVTAFERAKVVNPSGGESSILPNGVAAGDLEVLAGNRAARNNDSGVRPFLEKIRDLPDADWRYRHVIYLADQIERERINELSSTDGSAKSDAKGRREALEHERLLALGAERFEAQKQMLERVLSNEPKKFKEYEEARVQLATIVEKIAGLEAKLKPEGSATDKDADTTSKPGPTATKPVDPMKPDDSWDTSDFAPLVVRLRSRPCGISREQWVRTEIARACTEHGFAEQPEYVVVLERIGDR